MSKRLFWLIVAMCAGGLIVLASSSVVSATRQFGSASFYWVHQLLFGILPGVALMLVFWRIDYRRWRPFALPLLFAALALMVLVFVPSLGLRLKGSTSWLDFFGVSFQPAEVLKLALVIYLAAWLGENQERIKRVSLGLLPFVIIMGFISVLLVLQPDLGTLGLVMIIAGGVYFIAGAPLKQAFALICVAVVLIGSVAAFSPTRWSRITTLLNPTADTRGAGWQLNQSLIAIGAGGFWGVGYGQSTQKFGFLPEPFGDSIFAVLVEELGFVGGAVTIGLFVLLALMMLRVARRAPDPFGSLIVAGMLIWIMAQAAVNMAAVTGLVPLTGVPLPFVSYGGTSMVSMLAGLGIVLNIAKHA
ncbi:MAG TPA: putative lipid II flippase FtsW [Candidatus Paceibacterota bacterium]|nr:putative lipid II flippase FtsW [Candidatus Paceibacterota bacterium]